MYFSISQPECPSGFARSTNENVEVNSSLALTFSSYKTDGAFVESIWKKRDMLSFMCKQAHREKDDIHYAAVSVSLPNRLRRQRKSTDNECVYSSVK